MGIVIETQLEKQCIWAEAGVLNYRLCDRNFQCEHCPLDAALRDHGDTCRDEDIDLQFIDAVLTEQDGVPDSARTLLAPFLSVPLCTKARYSAQHVWVRTQPNGYVKCGLDAFAASLLPEDAQIVIVANNTVLREGDEFGWVYGGSHTLPLPAPVSGTVVCKNTTLRGDLRPVRQAPYGRGSVITLSPETGALAHAHLSSPRNHARRIRKRARMLTDRVTRAVASPDIGPCLNDGGLPVADIASLLGEDRFWRLLEKFIGGE